MTACRSYHAWVFQPGDHCAVCVCNSGRPLAKATTLQLICGQSRSSGIPIVFIFVALKQRLCLSSHDVEHEGASTSLSIDSDKAGKALASSNPGGEIHLSRGQFESGQFYERAE